MHFIVEEIDEDTSMEELQKMMLVALVYRILVCFYEVSAHRSSEGCEMCGFTLRLYFLLKNYFGKKTPLKFHLRPSLPDCVHLGSRWCHPGEVSPRSPSRHVWLISFGSAQQSTCDSGNKRISVCVSVFFFFFLLSGYISKTFSSIGIRHVIELVVLSLHTDPRSEPWTRTFRLHSFFRPSSRSSSSSTTGLCMIWSLGQSLSSDPGSDDAEVEEKNKLYDSSEQKQDFFKSKNAHRTAMFRYHWNVGVLGWGFESVGTASVCCDLGVCLIWTDAHCIPACMSSCCAQYLLLCQNIGSNTGRTMGNTLLLPCFKLLFRLRANVA